MKNLLAVVLVVKTKHTTWQADSFRRFRGRGPAGNFSDERLAKGGSCRLPPHANPMYIDWISRPGETRTPCQETESTSK